MMSNQHDTKTGAEAITEEFKDYAYSVSHDLSAPIRAMTEFSRILMSSHSESFTKEEKQYLSIVVENGERLRDMMDGLLEYSRLNTMASDPVQVNCRSVVKSCLQELADKINMSAAMVNIGDLPVVMYDENQIYKLFLALIDNAIKFREDGKSPDIDISASKTKDGWSISISDNGIGIEEKFYDRIFKLFQRLHTDEEYPGIGVGLTIARKIVMRHGGDMRVSSSIGEGSTFTFTIPDSEIING